jgi:GH25 family lysozyme M1 (1,4-beta-N-acetylmuramidase)
MHAYRIALKWMIMPLMCAILIEPSTGQDLSRVAIDLSSHNQGFQITPEMLKEQKIELIFHRATLGRYDKESDLDPLFGQRAKEVNANHSLFGAYHVPYPTSSGVVQAQGFIKALQEHCVPNQKILLAINWESVFVRWSNGETTNEPVGQSIVLDFIGAVNGMTGKSTVIYANTQVLEKFTSQMTLEQRSTLTSSPLWLAMYYTRVSRTRVAESQLGFVLPTDSDTNPWKEWRLWQFDDGKGPTPASRVSLTLDKLPVDADFYNGTRDDFRRFYEENAWNCGAATSPSK